MKICILGSHDIVAGSRGGTVYMAENLAAMGHSVTYVSSQASFLARLRGGAGYRKPGVHYVEGGIRHVKPRTFAPWRVAAAADRVRAGELVLVINRLTERMTLPAPLLERFDLCVASAAGTLTLVDRIAARRYVYRRNDVLSGFSGVPRALVQLEWDLLRSGLFSLASCVNMHLARDLEQHVSGLRTNVVPNGISLGLYKSVEPDEELLATRQKNVLFVGGVTHWVDVPLVLETARLLPDHRFQLHGPWHIPAPRGPLPGNVSIHGPIGHTDAIRKMKACAVGIIPSGRGNQGRMVVKPIKFYEYLAAGMGIAATSNAGEGLEPFAAVADGPQRFAQAILDAPGLAARFRADIDAELCAMDWKRIVPRIVEI